MSPGVATSSEDGKAKRKAQGLYPSRDVDLATALEIFSWNSYRFARSTEAFDEAAITALLAALVQKAPREARVLFLQTAVDPMQLQPSWRAAVNALKLFEAQYGWGSKEKKTKLAAIAKNPLLLAGAQAAAVGAEDVDTEVLAVLALDGSDASMDALLPHFARASKDPAQLDVLSKLATYAKKTEALTALLEDVHQRRHAREAGSPVLSLGKRLGLAKGERFRVSVRLVSTKKDAATVDLTLDNTRAEALSVYLFTGRASTHFDLLTVHVDDFKLGSCTPGELPAWLKQAQQTLSVRWKVAEAGVRFLRGASASTFTDWLLGPSAR